MQTKQIFSPVCLKKDPQTLTALVNASIPTILSIEMMTAPLVPVLNRCDGFILTKWMWNGIVTEWWVPVECVDMTVRQLVYTTPNDLSMAM